MRLVLERKSTNPRVALLELAGIGGKRRLLWDFLESINAALIGNDI